MLTVVRIRRFVIFRYQRNRQIPLINLIAPRLRNHRIRAVDFVCFDKCRFVLVLSNSCRICSCIHSRRKRDCYRLIVACSTPNSVCARSAHCRSEELLYEIFKSVYRALCSNGKCDSSLCLFIVRVRTACTSPIKRQFIVGNRQFYGLFQTFNALIEFKLVVARAQCCECDIILAFISCAAYIDGIAI